MRRDWPFDKTRQGHTGDGVRYVLGITLSLALMALILTAMLTS
jgi:hypothetical protein